MDEAVLYVTERAEADGNRLSAVLDAFARRCDQEAVGKDDADRPNIIMTTVHNGFVVRRKLAFETLGHATRFLAFWREEEREFSALVRGPLARRQETRGWLGP